MTIFKTFVREKLLWATAKTESDHNIDFRADQIQIAKAYALSQIHIRLGAGEVTNRCTSQILVKNGLMVTVCDDWSFSFRAARYPTPKDSNPSRAFGTKARAQSTLGLGHLHDAVQATEARCAQVSNQRFDLK